MTRQQRIAQLREFKLKISAQIKEMSKSLQALESAECHSKARKKQKNSLDLFDFNPTAESKKALLFYRKSCLNKQDLFTSPEKFTAHQDYAIRFLTYYSNGKEKPCGILVKKNNK